MIDAATAWIDAQAACIATDGRKLSIIEKGLARIVGVSDPDRVRVLMVPKLPTPAAPELQHVAARFATIAGLTAGHGIYIVVDHLTRNLLAHELRHVHQYEKFGSTRAFLAEYLVQYERFGYEQMPLELDARACECF